jgi:hypothetical protein
MTGATAPARSFTVLDVCDRCGAQACVRVLLIDANGNAGELLFCGHHGQIHSEALAKVARDVQDESPQRAATAAALAAADAGDRPTLPERQDRGRGPRKGWFG